MQKIKLIFCLSGLIYSNTVLSDPMRGYYIDLRGDTTYVIFDIPLHLKEPYYPMIQTAVKYFDSTGNVLKLRPRVTKMYCFMFKDTLITMKAYCTDGMGIPNTFFRLLVDGKLRLLVEYRYPGSWPFKYPPNENHFYQKGDNKLLTINPVNFKNQISKYLSEYPELAEKVSNKTYGYRDCEKIAVVYNAKW